MIRGGTGTRPVSLAERNEVPSRISSTTMIDETPRGTRPRSRQRRRILFCRLRPGRVFGCGGCRAGRAVVPNPVKRHSDDDLATLICTKVNMGGKDVPAADDNLQNKKIKPVKSGRNNDSVPQKHRQPEQQPQQNYTVRRQRRILTVDSLSATGTTTLTTIKVSKDRGIVEATSPATLNNVAVHGENTISQVHGAIGIDEDQITADSKAKNQTHHYGCLRLLEHPFWIWLVQGYDFVISLCTGNRHSHNNTRNTVPQSKTKDGTEKIKTQQQAWYCPACMQHFTDSNQVMFFHCPSKMVRKSDCYLTNDTLLPCLLLQWFAKFDSFPQIICNMARGFLDLVPFSFKLQMHLDSVRNGPDSDRNEKNLNHNSANKNNQNHNKPIKTGDDATINTTSTTTDTETHNAPSEEDHILCWDCAHHFVLSNRTSPPPIRCCYPNCNEEVLVPYERALALGRGTYSRGLQHSVYAKIDSWQRDYVLYGRYQKHYIKCPKSDCCWTVARDPQGPPKPVTCPSCKIDRNGVNTDNSSKTQVFCSQCGDLFHYHVKNCTEWQQIKKLWKDWQSKGRENNLAFIKREQARIQYVRKTEKEDERYKKMNCRHCPHCDRLVERIEGCSIMYCGFDTDTKGNEQSGCRQKFDWNKARTYQQADVGKYTASLSSSPHHIHNSNFSLSSVSSPRGFYLPTKSDSTYVVESQEFHNVNDIVCDSCGSTNVRGLLFECMNCPGYYRICEGCDKQTLYGYDNRPQSPSTVKQHPQNHVFRIHRETSCFAEEITYPSN